MTIEKLKITRINTSGQSGLENVCQDYTLNVRNALPSKQDKALALYYTDYFISVLVSRYEGGKYYASVLNTLRIHAYSNILNILQPKMENFQIRESDFFHISAQNIDCGYSLEPPQHGGSNEYLQSRFLAK